MQQRTCGNCRWWKHGVDSQAGQCSQSALALPEVYNTDFCGQWADKTITPEQEERRELVKRFAVAIVAAEWAAGYAEQDIWRLAGQMADTEPKILVAKFDS